MSLLESWTIGEQTFGAVRHPTYRKGTGPGGHRQQEAVDRVLAFLDEKLRG